MCFMSACSCCVRVIKSHRAGVGKTLKVKRLAEQLQHAAGKSRHQCALSVSIPLHCRSVDQSAVLTTLLRHTLSPDDYVPRIFHIDIAHKVTTLRREYSVYKSYLYKSYLICSICTILHLLQCSLALSIPPTTHFTAIIQLSLC